MFVKWMAVWVSGMCLFLLVPVYCCCWSCRVGRSLASEECRVKQRRVGYPLYVVRGQKEERDQVGFSLPAEQVVEWLVYLGQLAPPNYFLCQITFSSPKSPPNSFLLLASRQSTSKGIAHTFGVLTHLRHLSLLSRSQALLTHLHERRIGIFIPTGEEPIYPPPSPNQNNNQQKTGWRLCHRSPCWRWHARSFKSVRMTSTTSNTLSPT